MKRHQIRQQKWSGFPQISPDVIERIAQWEVADLAEVPKGGSQAMQEEILAELHDLLQERPDLADLVVRGIEAGLRPVDSYVRDFSEAEVQDLWAGTVRFLKASMIRFAILLLQTIEQARTASEDKTDGNG
jgi:hypothetical protein